MVALTSLWLPVLVAAVLVFVASSIIHMVLGYHNGDYGKLPKEDEIIAALRPVGIPPGDYFLPWAGGAAGFKDPAFQEKWAKGPVISMTVLPSGANFMGSQMAQWFIYAAVVAFFAGYVASRTHSAGRRLPDGVPRRRDDGVHGLLPRTVADDDLVQAVGHDERSSRRSTRWSTRA